MAASVRLPRRGTLPLLLLLSFVSSLIHLASAADDADAPLNLPPPLIGQCSWSRYGYPTFAVRGGLDGLDTCPRPVSDTTAAALGGYGPWSYPPYCIRAPRNATTGALGLKYCVYTHLTFRGRGLSVISTPQMAANLVPALDDTRVPPRLRDGPASTMARRDAVRASGGRSYAIKTVPGRGKGLVARRRVPKWGEALVGFPIMVARTDFLEALDSEDRKRLEHRALAQLPKMAQEAILGLAHGAAGGSDDHGFLLEEIFRSNIFGIELAGVPHFALQVEGSVSDGGRGRVTNIVLTVCRESTTSAGPSECPRCRSHPAPMLIHQHLLALLARLLEPRGSRLPRDLHGRRVYPQL